MTQLDPRSLPDYTGPYPTLADAYDRLQAWHNAEAACPDCRPLVAMYEDTIQLQAESLEAADARIATLKQRVREDAVTIARLRFVRATPPGPLARWWEARGPYGRHDLAMIALVAAALAVAAIVRFGV